MACEPARALTLGTVLASARMARVDVIHCRWGPSGRRSRRVDDERSTAVEIAIDMDKPEPLTLGEPVTLLFSLTPRPVLLKKGEKLRLDIASRTDLLRSDPAHGHEQFEMVVPPYFSRNTIHYGERSYLELHRRI